MDIEKYPHYFLMVIVVYAIILVTGMAYFVLPVISYGLLYVEFYVITALFLLPLVLLALYTKIDESFRGKFRLAITILTIVDFIFVLFMAILLI